MRYPGLIPIWFFVGCLMLVYGAMILAVSVYQLIAPPEVPVAMAKLHAGIWWGAILIGLGAIYFFHFGPWKHKT
jgi:hypothetical protein